MQITFDTNDLSPEDRALIAKAIGMDTEEVEEAPTPAPAKRTAAKKATPAKKAAAAPEPEEEADEDAPTLEDAIARAQELVGEKRTQEVKDAVAEIGVERVSKLKGTAQIKRFLELVADDADDAI